MHDVKDMERISQMPKPRKVRRREKQLLTNKVSWCKGDRARAKLEKKPLFMLALREGEDLEDVLVYSGVGDAALKEDIMALIKKHLNKEFADARGTTQPT